VNTETAIILLAAGNIAFGAGLIFMQIQFSRQRRHQAEANRAFHRINELQLAINRQQTELNSKNAQAIVSITDNLGRLVELVTGN
jgi:archaellum component FlaF (FlaF/FlaG flagellin family)